MKNTYSLCINFKIQPRLSYQQRYWTSNMWGVAFYLHKDLHDGIISIRGEVVTHKTSLAPPLLSRYLWQTRQVSGDVFVC